ncbi:MAG: FAD/NAD(P)-binding protein [bacterium]|nr:FAD/NAD(P)-binding protein [bacterium]
MNHPYSYADDREEKLITTEGAEREEENIFLPKPARVLQAQPMGRTEKYFRLAFSDGSSMGHQPGQIVEASLFGYGEIPLGIASSPTREGYFDLLIRKAGRVSTALWNLEIGDTMYIRGPLGKGFPVDEFKGHDVLIVAGGIGLCPTRSMIEYIEDRREEFGHFTLFFGARTPKDQLFPNDLARWREEIDWIEYHETVDQGSPEWKGNVGVITTLFAKTSISKGCRVIICGPPIMYKFVIKELKKLGIPDAHIYVDLERRMKCGVGKCGHCQINGLYVCTDGPVFNYARIKNLEEAF